MEPTLELEKLILKPGIIKEIGDKQIPTFPDYTGEINEFREQKASKKPQLPFVNQDKVLLQVARTLSTSYPYCVLVGESGIGKSMVLDYAVSILTGKVKLDELKKVMPEAVPLFKKIIDQTSRFEHRKYISVPNLADPLNVDTIAYTNQEHLDNDMQLALTFSNEISNLLKTYVRLNKDNLRMNMSQKDFGKFVTSKMHSIYIDIFEQVSENLVLKKKKDSMKKEPVALLEFNIPAEVYQNKKDVAAHITFTANKKDQKGKKKKLLLKHKQEIIQDAKDLFNELLYQVSIIEIPQITKNEQQVLFKKQVDDYMSNIIAPLYEQCKNMSIRNQELLRAILLKKVNYFIPERKISPKTIDDVLERLDDFRSSFIKDVKSEKLRAWMESVVDYFKSERKVIENNLVEMVKFDEHENHRLRTEIRKLRKLEDLKKLEDIILGKKHEKKKQDDEKKPKFPERQHWSIFHVPHGRCKFDIDEILCVRDYGYDFPTTKGVTWTKLGEINRETLFGTFDYDEDEPDEKLDPPHRTISTLGPFFKSGMLIFPDSFKGFIEAITYAPGMKEQFLEYLQTGILTVINGGVSYRFEAPKIILGCDNEDPFLITDGTIFVRDEVGFRGRIKTIDVPAEANNTKEVRKGTIKVLYDAIAKYVANSKTKGKPGLKLDITDQAANMLLQTTTESERLTSLGYREFVNVIEEICSYAVSKEKNTITAELLKEHIKDQIPPYFFYYVEREQEFGGYFDRPAKQIGCVNGLSVFPTMPAEVVKVRSYFKPGIDPINEGKKHFELVDIESKMTNATTIKGYELAKDFVTGTIAAAQNKGKLPLLGCDWQLKTHFGENWYGLGGPSASLAIALSNLSALSNEEMYKNRFVTGTIDPTNGNVGEIGGTYHKGLIPFRIKELLEARGMREEVYFLFPAPNLKDFTQDIIFDPFGLEQKVVCLPITTFAQAYHLFTCGPAITVDDWKNAQKLGEKKLEQTVERVYDRFKSCT